VLAAPDRSTIAERSFEPSGTCAEMATLAAVVITARESDVHPNYAHPAIDARSAPAAQSASAPASFDLGIGTGVSFAGSAQPGGSVGATWIHAGAGKDGFCSPNTCFPRHESCTAFTPRQKTPDLKSRMRSLCTLGNVGALGEKSPGATRGPGIERRRLHDHAQIAAAWKLAGQVFGTRGPRSVTIWRSLLCDSTAKES
jgi:hypothetical protein